MANCLLIYFDSEDQPGPPTNVVALPRSSSIVISWSPPVGNYSIRAYTVHYRQLDNVNSPESQDVVGKNTNSHKVSGLFGFTNYSLYVKAYTKVIGRESEIIVQRTLQGSKLTVKQMPLFFTVAMQQCGVFFLGAQRFLTMKSLGAQRLSLCNKRVFPVTPRPELVTRA